MNSFRFAIRFGFLPVAVQTRAIKIITEEKGKRALQGIKPNCMAAAIYMASIQISGDQHLSQAQIAKAAYVSEVSVRQNIRRLMPDIGQFDRSLPKVQAG